MSAAPDSDSSAPSLDGGRSAFMQLDADERAAVSKLVGKAVWANSTWLQRTAFVEESRRVKCGHVNISDAAEQMALAKEAVCGAGSDPTSRADALAVFDVACQEATRLHVPAMWIAAAQRAAQAAEMAADMTAATVAALSTTSAAAPSTSAPAPPIASAVVPSTDEPAPPAPKKEAPARKWHLQEDGNYAHAAAQSTGPAVPSTSAPARSTASAAAPSTGAPAPYAPKKLAPARRKEPLQQIPAYVYATAPATGPAVSSASARAPWAPKKAAAPRAPPAPAPSAVAHTAPLPKPSPPPPPDPPPAPLPRPARAPPPPPPPPPPQQPPPPPPRSPPIQPPAWVPAAEAAEAGADAAGTVSKSYRSMPWKELQAEAKAAGIPANQKKAVLVELLEQHAAANAAPPGASSRLPLAGLEVEHASSSADVFDLCSPTPLPPPTADSDEVVRLKAQLQAQHLKHQEYEARLAAEKSASQKLQAAARRRSSDHKDLQRRTAAEVEKRQCAAAALEEQLEAAEAAKATAEVAKVTAEMAKAKAEVARATAEAEAARMAAETKATAATQAAAGASSQPVPPAMSRALSMPATWSASAHLHDFSTVRHRGLSTLP